MCREWNIMKIKLISVLGLDLKISLNNNILTMSCNLDGLSIFVTRRIIRNSKLTESEIFAKIDSDWVSKIFAINIRQIKNALESNVSVIPVQSQPKQVSVLVDEHVPAFKNF